MSGKKGCCGHCGQDCIGDNVMLGIQDQAKRVMDQAKGVLDQANKGIGIKHKIISGQDKDKIQNKGQDKDKITTCEIALATQIINHIATFQGISSLVTKVTAINNKQSQEIE